MAENLYNSAHKTNSRTYRENLERIFGKKENWWDIRDYNNNKSNSDKSDK